MFYSGNPKSLSLLISILITILILALGLLWWQVFPQINTWSIIIFSAIIFISIYFISFEIIERFIYKKIKIIYKNIHNLKLGNQSMSKIIDKNDVIESVNKDVMEWADNQNKEISALKTNAKFRREFIGNLSHELRTPIFNIQGYILTLLDGGLYDKKINQKYLERSAKSVDRIIAMIDDLDIISKLESGNLEMKFVEFNIDELTEEVLEFFELKAEARNIKLTLSKNIGSQIKVYADKDKIRQVLINLIDNAIKYMIERAKPHIKISFFDMDENILVEVTDNGGGIPEKYLPRLFERFFRVDKDRSRQTGGTGLGLAIVKHIIDSHNQTIIARSTLGVGTTFGFTLKKI
ncbi:MAG: hypothetical protein AUJ98_00665 [Bacteroidetes bacterium CG2_30_33_31]|nr:MAG: hypothetical protein AUJ98_00665 [Bacteroidetes bacterium CG2_30_33_31]